MRQNFDVPTLIVAHVSHRAGLPQGRRGVGQYLRKLQWSGMLRPPAGCSQSCRARWTIPHVDNPPSRAQDRVACMVRERVVMVCHDSMEV